MLLFTIPKHFGVWFDYTLGNIYISYDYEKNSPFIFACTLADHSPNTLFINSAKKYSCWKTFIQSYNSGNLRFENAKIKSITQDLIKLLLTK